MSNRERTEHGFFWRGRDVTMLVLGVEGALAAGIAGAASWIIGRWASWWLAPMVFTSLGALIVVLLAELNETFWEDRL